MPVTTASVPALVAGAGPEKPLAVRVRLLRAICIGGMRVEPGAELDVDRQLASTLVGARKAERVAPAAPTESVSTEAPEPTTSKARRARAQE